MTDRLDAAVAARGLARSRTHAAQLIAEGRVSVDGAPVVKASARVAPEAQIDVAGADHYVSRAAHKLIAALDAFAIDPADRVAVDLGASTGGFTQVLRERGARTVIAVDVGHGQLDPRLAGDPGIRLVEGFNARYMTAGSLAEAAGEPVSASVVTADLSFISLTHVLPAIAQISGPTTDVVVLIKPQFEVGRTGVREGLVTAPHLRIDAITTVLWSGWDAGLGVRGIIASPLAGTHGNREYLAHLTARTDDSGNPTDWLSRVDSLVEGDAFRSTLAPRDNE